MGIPIRRGRSFTATDTGPQARALVINETLAKTIFPDEDPLGRELVVSWFDTGPDRIVGIVGDVRHEGMEVPARPTVYFTHERSATSVMHLVVKTSGNPDALGPGAGYARYGNSTRRCRSRPCSRWTPWSPTASRPDDW